MAAQECVPQVQACAVRVAAIDASGFTVPGASSMYVTDALVKLTLKPVHEEGDEIKEKNACGTTAIDYKSPPSFTRADIDLEFLSTDPFLIDILVSGATVLTSGGLRGFAYPPVGVMSGQCSLELWAKRINNGILDPTAPYARWALPFVNNVRFGDRDFSSAAGHTLLTAEAHENTNWFDGPANDWPVASDRVAQWIPVASLPVIDCTYDTVAAS